MRQRKLHNADNPEMSRVIIDPRDASKDKWILTSRAKIMYDRGELSVDETNSPDVHGHRVYCLSKGCSDA